jgi:Ca-activated chloride channel family protein
LSKKVISIVTAVFVVLFVLGMSAVAVSANGTEAPIVDKTASPSDINLAGSGSNEETTVEIIVTGAGGTSTTIVPMDVVFALDSSGSMINNDPTNERLAAAKSFVDKMDLSQDYGGVVSWDDNIDFTFGLSQDETALKTKIDAVDSFGGTNLNQGLNTSIAMLDATPRTPPWTRVIIFLTDGQGAYTPSGNPGSPADDAASKGYTIYSIGLGTANMAPLVDMAAATGGQAYNSPTPANLNDIFDDIFTEIVTSTIPYDVNVIEVLQPYMQVVGGSFNVAPDSIGIGGGGETIITWNDVGLLSGDGDSDLSADEMVVLSFNAKSTMAGNDLEVQREPNAIVEYSDKDGIPVDSVLIPQALINVNTPPDTTGAYADPGCIWPPNHKFVDISIAGVVDTEGDPLSITITGITSDEPTATDKGSGGAKHAPDADGVGTNSASVRAERSGDADGRVYVINFVASDGASEAVGRVAVHVPHDQSEGCPAVNSGQDYDATVEN